MTSASATSSPAPDSSLLGPRNARREATDLTGRSGARVLEPSPPAVAIEPFADEPLAVGGAALDDLLLPAGLGQSDWTRWSVDHPDHAEWVRSRWLGGNRRLPEPPPTLTATRTALHRLATYVIAPTRHAATGRFGLRWTAGGFGTPFFGDDRQIRVVADQLVDQVGDTARHTTITSLADAASFLGTNIDTETAAEHDSPAVGDIDADLGIDPVAATFLGEWFAMATAGLEAVRHDPASTDASAVQLWPGHFDPAIEIGDDDHRASYGASPGDAAIAEPYLYVSVWWPDRLGIDPTDQRWNAPGFVGAVLGLGDFAAGDPVERAVEFWTSTRDALG